MNTRNPDNGPTLTDVIASLEAVAADAGAHRTPGLVGADALLELARAIKAELNKGDLK